MAAKAIDYERGYDPSRPGVGGVMIGVHKVLNMDIYMYFDDPGVYLNAYGKRVPASMAEAAGFEVKKWEHARKKKLSIQSLMKSHEAAESADFAEEGHKVLAEHEGFRLIELPQDRATIIDPDGNPTFPPNSISIVKDAFESMYRALDSDYEEQMKIEGAADAEAKPQRAAPQRRGAVKAE